MVTQHGKRVLHICAVLLLFITLCVIHCNAYDNRIETIQKSDDCFDMTSPTCRVTFKLANPNHLNAQRVEKMVDIPYLYNNFEYRFDLPNPDSFKNVTVTGGHSKYPTSCQIANGQLYIYPQFYFYLREALPTLNDVSAVNNAFNTALRQKYTASSRIVECIFNLQPETAGRFANGTVDMNYQVFTSPFVPGYQGSVLLDEAKLKLTGEWSVISSKSPQTPEVFPALMYTLHSAFDGNAMEFVPNLTLTPDCYDPASASGSTCIGGLVNIPIDMLPLKIRTSHVLNLTTNVLNNTDEQCPYLDIVPSTRPGLNDGAVIVTDGVDILAGVAMQYYTLSLNAAGMEFYKNGDDVLKSTTNNKISCYGLKIEKAGLSAFEITKPYQLVVPYGDGISTFSPEQSAMKFIYSPTLYRNTKIQRQFIVPRLLADCFEHSHSTCTMAFVIEHPHAESSTGGAAADNDGDGHAAADVFADFNVDGQYLDENVFFNPKTFGKEQALTFTQQHHKVSWLSSIGAKGMVLDKSQDCSKNTIYQSWGLNWSGEEEGQKDDHAGNGNHHAHILCYTLRKSFSSGGLTGSATNNAAHVGGNTTYPQVDSQLMKLTFSGQFFQHQELLLQFTTNFPTVLTADNYGRLDLIPTTTTAVSQVDITQYTPHVLYMAPLPVYTTPVEVTWDHEACSNPKSQYCFATYRSWYIGNPLSITFSQRSAFLQHAVVDIVKCNSLNMGIDKEFHSISFPDPSFSSGQDYTTATVLAAALDAGNIHTNGNNNNNVVTQQHIVYLEDPYNTTKKLPYHECVVRYILPYDGDESLENAGVVYQPQIDGFEMLSIAPYDPQIPAAIYNITEDNLADVLLPYDTIRKIQLAAAEVMVNSSSSSSSSAPSPSVVATHATLFPFYQYFKQKVEEQQADPYGEGIDALTTLDPAMFPFIYNHSGTVLSTQNVANFMIVETMKEQLTASQQRVNSFATYATLSGLAHIPVITAEVADFSLKEIIDDGNEEEEEHHFKLQHDGEDHGDAAGGEDHGNEDLAKVKYNFKIRYGPLKTRFSAMLIQIKTLPDCSDKYLQNCNVVIKYPSYNWLKANGYDGTLLRSFSIYFDGTDYDQIINKDYKVETPSSTTNGLIPNIISVVDVPVTYNEMIQNFGITPKRHTMMSDYLGGMYAGIYYIKPPKFDPNAKGFSVFDFFVSNEHIDNDLNPLYTNPDLELEFVFTFRKKTQLYFLNEFANVHPHLISWGHGFSGDKRLWIISPEKQPVYFKSIDLGSHFQPDYPMEFDGVCGDPYASQCRVFVHREIPKDELFYYTLDLWSFSSGGADVIAPYYNEGKSPVSYAYLPAAYGHIIPLTFPVRPLDPTAWDANIVIVQFENHDYLQPVKHAYTFYDKFPFSYPPEPVLGADCTTPSEMYCSFTYRLLRPVYAPLVSNRPLMIAAHYMSTTEYFYVDESTLKITGLEQTDEDYAFSIKPEVSIAIDGDTQNPLIPGLLSKLIVDCKGDKRYLERELYTSVAITSSNQHPALWFNAQDYESVIDITLKFIKTGNRLHLNYRSYPQWYMAISLDKDSAFPVKGLRSVTIPQGLTYRPLKFQYDDNCQHAITFTATTPFNYTCTLKLQINADNEHPLYDVSRVLPEGVIGLYPGLTPAVLYFHTIHTVEQVTSKSDIMIRERYKQYECAKLYVTMIDMVGSIDDGEEQDGGEQQQQSRLRRWAVSLVIDEQFHHKSILCYTNLEYNEHIAQYWQLLNTQQESINKWGPLGTDLITTPTTTGTGTTTTTLIKQTASTILPAYVLQFYPNTDLLMPINLERFWNGRFYELKQEDLLEYAEFPPGRRSGSSDTTHIVKELQKAIIAEVSRVEGQDSTAINGIPRLPTYNPQIDIPAIPVASLLRLFHLKEYQIPRLFLEELPTYLTKGLPITSITNDGNVNPAFATYGFDKGTLYQTKVSYHLYEYEFRADIVDFNIVTNFGGIMNNNNNNGFAPCIATPNNLDDYLSPDAYLLLQQIYTTLNPLKAVQSTRKRIVPDLLEWEWLTSFPTVLSSTTLFDKLDFIVGLFHYETMNNLHNTNQTDNGATRMYINPDIFINAQFSDENAGQTDGAQLKAMTQYLTSQYNDILNNKPTMKKTLKNQKCYFYARTDNTYPSQTLNVPHLTRVSFAPNITSDGNTQHFEYSTKLSYQAHVKTASITGGVITTKNIIK